MEGGVPSLPWPATHFTLGELVSDFVHFHIVSFPKELQTKKQVVWV